MSASERQASSPDDVPPGTEPKLEEKKPLPSPRFRSGFRARLSELEERRVAPPAKLRLWVATCLLAGLALLALAALSLTGAGPFAS